MVDRPACERVVDARVMAMYEEHLQEAFTPAGGELPAVWRLGSVMGDQERLFKWRAGDPAVSPRHSLRPSGWPPRWGRHCSTSASRAGHPGIDGRTLLYPADRGEEIGAGDWQRARLRPDQRRT
ncbi:hypothetical protein [Streptomyces avermitilis]|uniref:hypothetical protein n=1 Tax=Streptomyces avermitilis TaxID=33903 RepID=UPI00371FC192